MAKQLLTILGIVCVVATGLRAETDITMNHRIGDDATADMVDTSRGWGIPFGGIGTGFSVLGKEGSGLRMAFTAFSPLVLHDLANFTILVQVFEITIENRSGTTRRLKLSLINQGEVVKRGQVAVLVEPHGATAFGCDGGLVGAHDVSDHHAYNIQFLTDSASKTGENIDSGIDVLGANAPSVPPKKDFLSAPTESFVVKTVDGKCEITFNIEKAPDLKAWTETNLAPTLAEWYPKIVALLASDGYTAPDHLKITLKPMDGVAYTAGRDIVANSDWLKKELNGEAIGALIHEAVHVVQQFNGKNPGWLVEGSADYFRWFKYEPQSHGADMAWLRKHGKKFSPNYNDSYRITANFLNWVSEKYDQDIVSQMNAAMRENRYDAGLWEKYTGKTAPELGTEWKAEVMAQLAASTE